MNTQWSKNSGMQQSNSEWSLWQYLIFPQEIKKVSSKQPNLTPKLFFVFFFLFACLHLIVLIIRERKTNKTQN